MAPARLNTYSLNVFGSVLETPQAFIRTITGEAADWKRSIRFQGGSWQGSFKLYGTTGFLSDVFNTWLGYDLREQSNGVTTWRGMIYEIDLVHGGVRRRRSLDQFTNYVTTTYITPGGDLATSAVAKSDRSIARFGRKEEILLQDGSPQHAAEANRDRVLTERGWPLPQPVSVGDDDTEFVEVYACGYAFTLNWRFTTQITEYDSRQAGGTGTRFDDIGADPHIVLTDVSQDFTEWQSLAAPAMYSVWVTAEGTLYWGYCGAADTESVANDSIHVYQDQALTTEGWNGGVPTKPLSISGYWVRGSASEWLTDIITTDAEFVDVGGIDTNALQVNRIISNPTRCWDIIMDVAELGDTDGDPWRAYVDVQNLFHYEQISKTPRYYIRAGGVFDSMGGRTRINPWMAQPGIIRDLANPVRRAEYDGWLDDSTDIYAEEVEVSANDPRPQFRTSTFEEADLLMAISSYTYSITGPEKRQRGILPAPDNGNRGGWDKFPSEIWKRYNDPANRPGGGGGVPPDYYTPPGFKP